MTECNQPCQSREWLKERVVTVEERVVHLEDKVDDKLEKINTKLDRRIPTWAVVVMNVLTALATGGITMAVK